MGKLAIITAVMNEVNVVNRTLQHVVDDLIGRGNDVMLFTTIRVSFDHHDPKKDFQSTRIMDLHFNVAYNPKSNYVAVLWKPFTERIEDVNGRNYQLLSDHSSCWRDSWGDIKGYIRGKYDEFTKDLTKHQIDCNISHLTTIERMTVHPVESRDSYDYLANHIISLDENQNVIVRTERKEG